MPVNVRATSSCMVIPLGIFKTSSPLLGQARKLCAAASDSSNWGLEWDLDERHFNQRRLPDTSPRGMPYEPQ